MATDEMTAQLMRENEALRAELAALNARIAEAPIAFAQYSYALGAIAIMVDADKPLPPKWDGKPVHMLVEE